MKWEEMYIMTIPAMNQRIKKKPKIAGSDLDKIGLMP